MFLLGICVSQFRSMLQLADNQHKCSTKIKVLRWYTCFTALEHSFHCAGTFVSLR